MSVHWLKKVYLFAVTALFLLVTVPVSAHDLMMAGSKWFFSRNGSMVATIELHSSLLAEIKGIGEAGHKLNSGSDRQFQKITTGIIQRYIDKKLSISVNGKTYPITVGKIERSKDDLWKIWLQADNISFSNAQNLVKIYYSLLFEETGNAHINIAYMYLPEAAGDTAQKVFDSGAPIARNNFDCTAPTWEISIAGPAASGNAAASEMPDPAGKSFRSNVREFVILGIKHILSGYDHIAFLLVLIVIGLSFKEVLKIITAFTIAHSITLLLAALQIVSLNSRFVESVIALSICYVALENLFRKEVNYRWVITFCFGLIHGFGFASILQELILSRSNLIPSVLSFNIGVEIGQLMIFLVMLPVLYLLRSRFEFRKITATVSVAVFIIGFTWLVERVFNLELLSF